MEEILRILEQTEQILSQKSRKDGKRQKVNSKIIIMLTHNDQTVKNAIEVFDTCKDLPVDYWGFKDVGLEKAKMVELIQHMKEAGKTTFLEVVTYTEEACMNGAKLAVELGFDYLMGTLFYDSVYAYLKEHEIKYLPFCGNVSGSPSVLEGSFDDIIEDASHMLDQGVDGIDLLAFRHEQGGALAREYCARVNKPVVIAGSINSEARISFINEINPWAFTMGSALFTENFAPGDGFRENLQEVIAYMNEIK